MIYGGDLDPRRPHAQLQAINNLLGEADHQHDDNTGDQGKAKLLVG